MSTDMTVKDVYFAWAEMIVELSALDIHDVIDETPALIIEQACFVHPALGEAVIAVRNGFTQEEYVRGANVESV